MIKKTYICILLFLFLSGCGTKQVYLVKNTENPPPRYVEWECLNQALHEVNSGTPPLSQIEKAPLRGIKTDYFLWWGSLAGPKPVVNSKGHISEARSALAIMSEYKRNVAERYVMCLLNNGYMWPEEELVKQGKMPN